MSSGSIEARGNIDSLLNNQTQRLEDIANNAVDFIKINLLVLGAFAPFVATVLTDQVTPQAIIESNFVLYSTASWVISTFLSTVVYRNARAKSTSQFETLEEAIVDNWREADLRDEIIDNSDQYESLINRLMILLSASIGLSLIAILFLSVGVYDLTIGLSNSMARNLTIVILILGLVISVGKSIKNSIQKTPDLVLNNIPEVSIQFGRITIENTPERPDDIVDFIAQTENLSRIRSRLLNGIKETVGIESWLFSELSDELIEKYPDIGLTRAMVERLRDDGYLKKIQSTGPATFVVHQREEEIINSENLDKVVGEELGRIIGHMRTDEEIRKICSKELGTTTDKVEDELVSGTTTDRIQKLNDVIEAINKEYPEKEPEGKNYGKIEFRQRETRYLLSPKGVRPFTKMQLIQARKSLEQDQHIQASVLASQALEMFLRSLLKSENPSRNIGQVGMAHLINEVRNENILSEIDISRFDHLRSIRNKAVHDPSSEEDIEDDEISSLIETSENIVEELTDGSVE